METESVQKIIALKIETLIHVKEAFRVFLRLLLEPGCETIVLASCAGSNSYFGLLVLRTISESVPWGASSGLSSDSMLLILLNILDKMLPLRTSFI